MNPPPVNLPRHPPRFLPTLTEVVDPEDLAAALSAPLPMPHTPRLPAVAPPEDSSFDTQLSATIRALVSVEVAQQMQALRANLVHELDVQIEKAVQRATQRTPTSR